MRAEIGGGLLLILSVLQDLHGNQARLVLDAREVICMSLKSSDLAWHVECRNCPGTSASNQLVKTTGGD